MAVRVFHSFHLWIVPLWAFAITASEALAAPKGFGSKPTQGDSVGKQTKKKKRPSTLETFREEVKSEPAPKLDKWGLPPPTLEDIFPPLSDHVERRSARENYTLEEIQSALQGYMDLDLSGAIQSNCKVSLVHESPPVLIVDDFLTAQECQQVQLVAGLVGQEQAPKQELCHAPVKVQSATMSQSLAQSVRTSTSWFCHYQSVSTLLIKMEELLGIPLPNVEEPQIVQYQASQEFSWHYDHLPPNQLANGGQRIATVLVYLNDCPESPTVFRDLQSSEHTPLSVRPVTGRALVFFPADASGVPDERTLHCGKPAVATEKHLVQCWVHQFRYTATLPPGNRQSDIDRASARQSLGFE